jgi:polar amino acid transport system substrate-binding protein
MRANVPQLFFSQRRTVILVWGLVPVLLLLAACSSRPDTLGEIQERGMLYIGLDPSYPPFEALAPGGELYGVDVDLGRELAGRLGVESNFVLLSYDGLYDALEVGQVDLLISALVVEPGRMDDVAYSHSYFDAGVALVTSVGAADELDEMKKLAGRTVAVEYATEGDVEARRWGRRLGDLTVLPVTTADEALAAVHAGKADAALVDGISARLYLREHPDLVLAPELVTSQPYAVVVRADDRSLLGAVNDVLDAMVTEGVLDAIIARWL